MARLRPRNWSEFQHYKSRTPPWIKLHRGLLDDFEFNSLPLEARALAPMLWLLASEASDGAFDADAQKLAFRLRTSVEQVASALLALCDSGLFEVAQDASPETEGESETEEESDSEAAFEEFWTAFDPPKNARKPEARRAWAATQDLRPPQKDLLAAVAAYRAWVGEQSRRQKRDYPLQHPSTWLRGEVWNGFLQAGDARAAAQMLDGAWEGRAAPLVAGIGAAQFAAWFSNANFSPGPPARITVQGEFKRKWIAEHFGAALRRCYGDVVVEVA